MNRPTEPSALCANVASATKPLGLLIIGRKRPGFDQEWNQIMVSRATAALREMGLTTIGGEAPVVDDETIIAALERIRLADCDSLLVLQPSLGNGQFVFTTMQRWNKPIVLWATPERAEGPKVSSCSLVAQHLWASVLRQSRHPFEFVYGEPGDTAVREELHRALRVSRVPVELSRTKIGLVGAHAPGFIGMAADPIALRRQLGVQLATLSLPMFLERTRSIDESRVAEDVKKAQAMKLPLNGVSADDLAGNSRYYLAMRDLMTEERLDALAVQCWPEMSNMVGQWPYLALTRLTDEGAIASMEGDVDGALTCLIGKLLGAGVGFITDWLEHDKNTIHFWHPGVAPLALCNPCNTAGGPSMSKHFNIEKPMVVDGPLRTDMPVTIARLWRCDDRYHLTALQGRTIKPRRQISGNTALVQAGMDVAAWFDQALHAGLPHHVIVFAGLHADSLHRTARLLGVDWFSPLESSTREVHS